MPRYIDADKLLEYYEERHKHLCERYGETDEYCKGYEDAMYVAEYPDFAADAVPREEVETLKDNNEHLAVMLSEAKADVAREIFAEINAIKREYSSGDIDGNELYLRLYILENKYTEEKA